VFRCFGGGGQVGGGHLEGFGGVLVNIGDE
jgi:hypothetical protein